MAPPPPLEPQAGQASTAAGPSVFRCGHGASLRAWVHLNAHGPGGPGGKIERYDYESEDADEVIEEAAAWPRLGGRPWRG
jgi:hypothetical protein